MHHPDTDGGEVAGVADPGQLQQLRGVERPRGQHDLARGDLDRPARALLVAHADRPVALDPDLGDQDVGADLQVGPVGHGVQERPGRREPTAAVDRAFPRAEPLRVGPVEVGRQPMTGLLRGAKQRSEQRVGDRAALEPLRAPVAAHGPGRADRAGLQPLEVRQAVRVVPLAHARVGTPALVVQGVAALEDHRVDAAGPADQLAARMLHASAVHVRLGLGLVAPVMKRATDRETQRPRHVDHDIPQMVGTPGLQQQHTVGRVGTEPVGQHRTGRPGPDDHKVDHAATPARGTVGGSHRTPVRKSTTRSVPRAAPLEAIIERRSSPRDRSCCQGNSAARRDPTSCPLSGRGR